SAHLSSLAIRGSSYMATRRIGRDVAVRRQGAGARPGRHRHGLGPPPPSHQAALTSIVLGMAARGAGIRTSSMPFAYFASTWVASTPSGSAQLRWNRSEEHTSE